MWDAVLRPRVFDIFLQHVGNYPLLLHKTLRDLLITACCTGNNLKDAMPRNQSEVKKN
jgi:hypothetical protein